MGDYGKGIKYSKLSLKISKAIGYKRGEARVLEFMGYIYLSTGKFDDALKLFTEVNQQFELAKTYYYFGNALREMEDEATSSNYLSKSKRLFKSMGAMDWLNKFN